MSSGPSEVSKGRPPSDVWCNHMIQEEKESADEDESVYPNKRARQTEIKNFYGGSKIEKGRSDELDQALEPGYDPPSRRVLSALDGWTDPRGNSLWAFILLTPSRKEYLLQLEDLSKNSHTAEYLSNVINDIICKIKRCFITCPGQS
ncbi:unnamed protein product [Rhizophagus irregularis]|nr:unnamed protein product [Rhizophagus irregularis]